MSLKLFNLDPRKLVSDTLQKVVYSTLFVYFDMFAASVDFDTAVLVRVPYLLWTLGTAWLYGMLYNKILTFSFPVSVPIYGKRIPDWFSTGVCVAVFKLPMYVILLMFQDVPTKNIGTAVMWMLPLMLFMLKFDAFTLNTFHRLFRIVGDGVIYPLKDLEISQRNQLLLSRHLVGVIIHIGIIGVDYWLVNNQRKVQLFLYAFLAISLGHAVCFYWYGATNFGDLYALGSGSVGVVMLLGFVYEFWSRGN